MIGQTISHYKILEKLGEGGMGVVYKAHDTKLDRTVALKFLPQSMASTETEKNRFFLEAKAASSLDHPNVCTVYEIDETAEGELFISMAYYEGETLKERVEKGQLGIDESVEISVQLALGLQAAHAKGMAHRDIKSANIMLTRSGQTKIMDFGLAKLVGRTQLTKAGTTIGTIAYMSPEQARGDTVDERTDIWSLGVVLYEMLAGQLPFSSQYEQAVVYSIMNVDPKPIMNFRSDVPPDLQRIIDKTLQKNRDDRYQSIGDMIMDLRRVKKESTEVSPMSLQSIDALVSLPARPPLDKTPGRKLAAIMFTDIVGYSSLTQKNEALALELLNDHRKLSRPVFLKHNGREIKTIGDAFMVEFESTLDAVRCSIDMQKVIAGYNAAQAPERRIEHRIGIHVGDVVFRGSDVFGDGVNIAARIQPLAEPGGICISEDIARQIQNKIELPLTRLGRGELKNIKLPVTIYRVELPWKKRHLPFAQRLEFSFRRRRKKLLTALIPVAVLVALFLILRRTFIPVELVSVAVLPLEITGSSSEDNTWLAEGIGQSIANKLTNLKNLQVTPWATSQRYRDRSVSLKDLAKELGVQRLIVGTIRVLGERVQASIQLIDPFGNQQLWADEFEEKASDIFAVQTKIALGCAVGLKGNMSSEEATIMSKPPAERADAFEFYIKGSMKMQSETQEDDNIALAFFDRAIELDPNLAEARVGRGAVYSARFFYGFGGKEALDAAMENYKIALALDPKSTNARRGLIAQLWQMGLSEECLKQGVAIRKEELNDVGALFVKADAYWVGGLPDKAVTLYEKILQLDRANQGALYFLILNLNLSLQPQKAIDAGETYFERFGEDPVVHMYVARSHHMLGDLDAARIHYERALVLFGENVGTTTDLDASDLYRHLGDTAKAFSLLTNLSHRLEGKLQAYPSNFRMAGVLADCYARIGDYDDAEKLMAQARQYSYPAHHFLGSAKVLLRAGRSEIARTIFQDILSNGTDVLLDLRGMRAMGEKLSEVEKEGIFDKEIELDAKYRALY